MLSHNPIRSEAMLVVPSNSSRVRICCCLMIPLEWGGRHCEGVGEKIMFDNDSETLYSYPFGPRKRSPIGF